MENKNVIRAERAAQLFMEGYNCGQAAAIVFADRYGLTTAQMARISAAFGGGIGRQRMTCGTVLAMAVLAGLEETGGNPAEREATARCMNVTRQLTEDFKEQFGSAVCGEILGLKGFDKAHGKSTDSPIPQQFCSKPCALKVMMAVRIFEKYLNGKDTTDDNTMAQATRCR